MKPKTAKALETGLFIFGIVGVVVTAVSSARDTLKAEQVIFSYQVPDEDISETKEKLYKVKAEVKAKWKCYIPTLVIGTATISSLIVSNRMSAKTIVLLSSAVASSGGLVTRYRNEIREISGEDILREVDKRVAEKEIEHAKPPVVTTSGLLSSEHVDLADDGEFIFFDPFTKVKFVSTKLAVLGAKYYLNRNFQLGSEAPLSMFYAFLGLDLPEEYQYAGWDVSEMADDGFYWIDIDIVKADEPDPETGKPYYILEYEFLPGDCDENYYPYGNPILTEGSYAV